MSARALARVRRAALDTIGVMLAGAAEPVARIVRRIVRVEGGIAARDRGRHLAQDLAGWAALANGVAGHAHDFDDTNFALLGHPSVPLLSTALAAAEAETADGASRRPCYIIGFEVDAALGTALNPVHYTRGWHATSSIGTLGCAAAAARILGLDVVQTRHALGDRRLARVRPQGELRLDDQALPRRPRRAERALGRQLAREGMTASASALEGRQGYIAAFGGGPGSTRRSRASAAPGICSPRGSRSSRIPSCALTHSAIDALIDLRTRTG